VVVEEGHFLCVIQTQSGAQCRLSPDGAGGEGSPVAAVGQGRGYGEFTVYGDKPCKGPTVGQAGTAVFTLRGSL
jgi:hypothetical protein